MAKAEGKTFEYLDESHINPSLLEVFDFDSPEQYIKTETDEFSAVCPFSGLPDISYVKIEYHPRGGKCVELKSLKYYLMGFTGVGIVQEHAANRILNDLVDCCNPKEMTVDLEYKVRGGITTKVSVSRNN